MSTLLIPLLQNLIYFIGSSGEREGEVEREREREYKTTFSPPKQEHLLIVEVTVSVQPHALNTTLLVLMMRGTEGGRKDGERPTEAERRGEGEDGDGRIGLFSLSLPLSMTPFTPTPTPTFPPPLVLRKVHLSFHIHLKRFFLAV